MSRTIVPLHTIADEGARRPSFTAKPTCQSSSCGSGQASTELPEETRALINEHPCYSLEAHHFFARMHLAVAPACNIQCNYCNRKYDCPNESRPGVTSERLTPDAAVRRALSVAARMPELSVIGIAGPGDALADHRRTFETVARLKDKLPDVHYCLSTNGLALPDHVETIRALDVRHVTVTMNAIDPEIAERIYAWIFFDHRRITGLEAARILIERQLEGISQLVAAKVLVKVNSVLIPGINDTHLEAVHAEITRRGAFLHNVVPLISDPAHGTHFGMTGQRGPSPAELTALQERLGDGVRLMRHCRQCRADAVGMLAEDCGASVVADDEAAALGPDAEARESYRAVVAREREDRLADEGTRSGILSTLPSGRSRLFAVSSRGGGRVNQHFGKTQSFLIYAAETDGIRFIGSRRADKYCVGGDGDDHALDRMIEVLNGVDTVLCAKVGACPRHDLAEAGITVTDAYAYEHIETAIMRCLADEVRSIEHAALSA